MTNYIVVRRLILLVASLAGIAHQASAQTVTPARLERPAAADWLQVGRTYDNQRYSPLTQLTRANVASLGPQALFQLQMSRPMAGTEATPIVADGRLYVTTDYSVVTAFDLRSRTQLWRYEPKVDAGKPCCGPVNRGVAVAHGLIYLGTLDSRVVALTADSGTVRWETLNNDPDSAYSLTMAPIVVGDRVIVGTSGGEFAIRGSVTAYDAHTGKRIWRWYTIPAPEDGGWWGSFRLNAPTGEDLHRDVARERADSARYADSWRRGGGPVWTQPAYDPESRLLYVAVGNPAPSNDGVGRPGDNLYTSSVVALDVATGQMRWYFQAVPHDVWDYDLATPPVIARVANRKALLVGSKMGWVYVLDAETGALIRRSQPFVPQKNLFTVPTTEGVVVAPGPFGGSNWPPSAYSPQTGLMYVIGTDWPFLMTRREADPEKGEVWIGGDYTPQGAPKGVLSALDPRTGKIVWQRPGPVFASGALVTAGGLLFVGDTEGWFRAYDARTGEPVWQFFSGAGLAAAASYELDGRQYLAVVAAGNRYSKLRGSAVLVFGAGTSGVTLAGQPSAVAPARPRPSAPAADASWPPSGTSPVGRYVAYDSVRRTAWIMVDAGASMTFNGAVHGVRTVSLPVGWNVELRFRNRDVAPHSVRVVRDTTHIPLELMPAVFAGGESEHADVGSASGANETVRFTVDRAGDYLIACAVPGHASAGMFVRLKVRPDLAAPAYH